MFHVMSTNIGAGPLAVAMTGDARRDVLHSWDPGAELWLEVDGRNDAVLQYIVQGTHSILQPEKTQGANQPESKADDLPVVHACKSASYPFLFASIITAPF